MIGSDISSQTLPTGAGKIPRVLLTLLPEPESVISCLETAIAAAFEPQMCILAVHIGFDPKHAIVDDEEMDIQFLREKYEGTPEVRAARVKAAYDAWLSNSVAASRVRWKDDEGDITTNVIHEVASADLVIIGHPVHMDAADALHAALFNARRLVLIAPRHAKSERQAIGHHIVIGWKPGEPARHAVMAAVPWLQRADKVTVVCVTKDGTEPYHLSARELLGKLGIAADYLTVEKGASSVGDRLLAEASRLGADSLVIGAFHHGQLWQAVFGGVTRDVLKHAELPVFMMR